MPVDQTFVNEVGAWADGAFPRSTIKTMGKKLVRESDELDDAIARNSLTSGSAEVGDELADCYLIALHVISRCQMLADKIGIPLDEAARVKFEVCKTRTWAEPDADGIVEHVRGEQTR